jgi:ketosteroid isomerase-like protein
MGGHDDRRTLMPPSKRSSAPTASRPEELHAALEEVFASGDVDAFLALHEPDATTRTPPDGRVVHGLDAIRDAITPILVARPRLTSTMLGLVEGNGQALAHARWELRTTGPDGAPVERSGRGTIVSRQRADGTWGIVFDDPMTPTP